MPITLSLKRAAEETGLSPRTLAYAIARGELVSIRVGRRRLISVAALNEFLAGRKPKEAEEGSRDL